jgi:cupin 2 domain-containing protein
MNVANIFSPLPENLEHEFVDTLIEKGHVKIERIVSKGHRSPDTGWYDQDQDEWVIVLQGAAILSFPDDEPVSLKVGDHVCIPAGCRHRVSWTDPNMETVWIAVFYGAIDNTAA